MPTIRGGGPEDFERVTGLPASDLVISPMPIGIPWLITVTSADGKRVVWHGSSRDRAEIERLAAEARQQMPGLWILNSAPAGEVYSWGGDRCGDTAGCAVSVFFRTCPLDQHICSARNCLGGQCHAGQRDAEVYPPGRLDRWCRRIVPDDQPLLGDDRVADDDLDRSRLWRGA